MTGAVRGASLEGGEYGGVGLTVDIGGLVRRTIDEIWNRRKLALADLIFTPGYVNHGGLIPDLIRGPEAIKFSVALYRRAFPDFHIAVDGVTKEGDAIVIRWVAHCRRTLMRGRVDREGGLRGITRCRLENHKVAERWTVWDSRAALARFGPIT